MNYILRQIFFVHWASISKINLLRKWKALLEYRGNFSGGWKPSEIISQARNKEVRFFSKRWVFFKSHSVPDFPVSHRRNFLKLLSWCACQFCTFSGFFKNSNYCFSVQKCKWIKCRERPKRHCYCPLAVSNKWKDRLKIQE